jgi:cobalt-precorrin 5A hydrolase
MGGDQAMTGQMAIGIGCRKGCSAASIEALVRQALDRTSTAERCALFTIADKSGEPGMAEAAERLGLSLVFLSREILREQVPLIQTRSTTTETLFGVPAVAEAAALAGAGPGSVLLVPRIANAGATCAIAGHRDDPL